MNFWKNAFGGFYMIRTYEVVAGDTPCGPVTLKFIEIKGKYAGPTLVLVSGVHGDELSSIGGLYLFLDELAKLYGEDGIRGKILALPFANPLALMQRTWGFQLSGVSDVALHENLNRCFPGDPTGTFGERLAHVIFTYLLGMTPDLVIDLHCMPSSSCIIVDPIAPDAVSRHSGIVLRDITWNLAEKLGLGVVHDFPDEEYQKERLYSSLSAAFIQAGIPACTVEVPGGPVSVAESEGIVKSVIWNAVSARTLNIVPAEKELYNFPVTCPNAWLSRSELGVGKYACMPGPRAEKSGFFRPLAGLAKGFCKVRKGILIGEILGGALEKVADVRSPVDGFLAYFSNVSMVSEGDRLCWFFVEEKK